MAHAETQGTTVPLGSLPQKAPRSESIRARALIIGSLAVAATAMLVTQAEMVLSSVRIGYLQFPPVALGLMLLVVMISRGLKRVARRWSLTSSDLLVIYCMTLVAAMVSSHGVAEKFIPQLVQPLNGANANNGWFSLFAHHIQQRLVPWDVQNSGRQAVTYEWQNTVPRGGSVPWQPWVIPVLNWGLLIFLVLFSFLCLTAILRRQWVDGEKLSFPLAQLPLEIAGDQDRPAFFRNGLMWLGASIPILVYVIKGLHQIQPTIPDVTIQWSLGDYLTSPPWSSMAWSVMFILSFAALGFFFLLPTDVLFSIWFFFLLSRVEQVLMLSFNQPTPAMPIYPLPMFMGYQTVGAYLVLSGYLVWIARPHLRRVWASALGRPGGYSEAENAEELMPYRFAVWGLLGSIVAGALWTWGMGMSLWLAFFELVVFIFVTAVVMARSTAEAGLLMTETTFRPVDLLRMVMPIHALGPQNLTMLSFFDIMLLRDQRGLVLTGMLDSARLSDGTNIRRRSFLLALVLGIVLAFAVAVPLNIYLPYHLGALRMDNYLEQVQPQWGFSDYAPAFQAQNPLPTGASWQMPTFFGVGVLVTIFLTLMRTAFFWWPLHPLGYALAGSWSTIEFWFPCLLAWIFKSLILRYGGMGSYSRARPFFLGLILGEFGMAVFFVLLNALSAWISPDHKIPAPAFPWG